MNRILATLAVTSCIVCVGANAQFSKPDAAIEYRQGALTVMSHHFGQIGAALKGTIPFDAAEVAANAALVETMAKLPWSAFPAGSTSSESHAKPEIWKDQAKFKQLADDLQDNTAKLSTAAETGDQAAVKAAFFKTAETCKSCHDSFRSKS